MLSFLYGIAKYQTDLLYIYYGLGLLVTFVNVTNTDYGNIERLRDAILPAIFLENITTVNSRSYCQLPKGVRPRELRLYVGPADYLAVPLLFAGGTADYSTCVEQVKSNSRIENYIIRSEKIQQHKLDIFVAR